MEFTLDDEKLKISYTPGRRNNSKLKTHMKIRFIDLGWFIDDRASWCLSLEDTADEVTITKTDIL